MSAHAPLRMRMPCGNEQPWACKERLHAGCCPSYKHHPLQSSCRRSGRSSTLCPRSHVGETVPFTPELAVRTSADEVKKEILNCYKLIHKLGKGVVYLGSSRTKPEHPHFVQAMELGREVASLLDCTTWTGVGPGLMDAVVQGALQIGKPVGGFKIAREAGEWTTSNFHPYLENHVYYTCRFFSARKHGLVDAAVREQQKERTAFVALPGGLGTIDEIFEILTLQQLERIGSKYPVPLILMNYDGFYTKLFEFLSTCRDWGAVNEGEVEKLWTICDSNKEALEYLADFYDIREKFD